MIKAGYKGSTINEVTWIGNLVSDTAYLCSKANRSNSKKILYSNIFYSNLKEKNQKKLNKNKSLDCYEGTIINTKMDDWVQENG